MRRVLSPVSIAVLCLLAGLLVLLGYGLASNSPDRSIDEALARGEREPAPALDLPVLDGEGSGSLSDHRGKVVVLNFWGSWCRPCRNESPLLQRWHRRMLPKGGTVLGVDILDTTPDALAFIERYDLRYPMLKDKDGDSLESYGVIAYPETFVIDRRGRIAAAQRGPVDDEFMRTEVAPLLGES
ncbi:MAG TPA: TlpA disulfide reductase family protein [Thermoleophilaceae bacterium]|nr:TlpA disulfide reductase family protein [Thermoleophilaceae bacterium]